MFFFLVFMAQNHFLIHYYCSFTLCLLLSDDSTVLLPHSNIFYFFFRNFKISFILCTRLCILLSVSPSLCGCSPSCRLSVFCTPITLLSNRTFEIRKYNVVVVRRYVVSWYPRRPFPVVLFFCSPSPFQYQVGGRNASSSHSTHLFAYHSSLYRLPLLYERIWRSPLDLDLLSQSSFYSSSSRLLYCSPIVFVFFFFFFFIFF